MNTTEIKVWVEPDGKEVSLQMTGKEEDLVELMCKILFANEDFRQVVLKGLYAEKWMRQQGHTPENAIISARDRSDELK